MKATTATRCGAHDGQQQSPWHCTVQHAAATGRRTDAIARRQQKSRQGTYSSSMWEYLIVLPVARVLVTRRFSSAG